jgi:hypothetical protein
MNVPIPRIKFKEPYSKILSQYKSPITFLEIGLDTGNSLSEWKSFFLAGSEIYGIDITLKNIQANLTGFNVFEIDSTNKELVNKTFKDGMFDVIVDDGSPNKHMETFEIFKQKMKIGGTYLIETFREPSAFEMYRKLLSSENDFITNYRRVMGDSFLLCTKLWTLPKE